MAVKLLALALLSSFAHLSQAANITAANATAANPTPAPVIIPTPSADEKALWTAITDPGESVFVLTRNIILSADLPPLPNKKQLLVRSDGTRLYRIDGANKYKMFRNAPDAVVLLSLTRLVVTQALFSAVELSGDGTYLSVNTVTFSSSPRALTLTNVKTNITNSIFSGHKNRAILIKSEESASDTVTMYNTIFRSNSAPAGEAGGAIRVFYGTLIATSCTFDGNSATDGGAVSFASGFGTIKTSLFSNNKATASGGAVVAFDSGVLVYDSNFYNNSASTSGGGAVCIASKGLSSAVTFYGGSFQKNSAVYGGAFILEGAETLGTFCKPSFWRNTANGTLNIGYGRVGGNAMGIVRLRPSNAIPGMVIQPRTMLRQSNYDCQRV